MNKSIKVTSSEEKVESSVVCHAYDLNIVDAIVEKDKSEIHMWCLTRESVPVLVRVQDYPHYLYAELPKIVNGKLFEWNGWAIDQVMDYLKGALREHAPESYTKEKKKKINYYRNMEFNMLRMNFSSHEALNHCINLLKKPKNIKDISTNIKFEIWETSFDNIRKMMTDRNCKYAQWFECTGVCLSPHDDDRVSVLGRADTPIQEYIIPYKAINPISQELTKSWMTNPGMLAIDIENYSDNFRAFPSEMNPEHLTYLISCVYQRNKCPNTKKRYAILVGDCGQVDKYDEIFRVDTELEAIDKLSELTMELDPDIVTGYNIFAYDYPYMNTRIVTKLKEWKQMGRLKGVLPVLKSSEWSSSAYGKNDINILKMDGRISVDMYQIMKRDYKLDKYTLNFVGKKFLKQVKVEISIVETFERYQRYMNANKIINAIRTNMFNIDLMEIRRVLSTYNIEDPKTIKQIKRDITNYLFEILDANDVVFESLKMDKSEVEMSVKSTLNKFLTLEYFDGVNRTGMQKLATTLIEGITRDTKLKEALLDLTVEYLITLDNTNIEYFMKSMTHISFYEFKEKLYSEETKNELINLRVLSGKYVQKALLNEIRTILSKFELSKAEYLKVFNNEYTVEYKQATEGMTLVVEYCIQDSELVINLIEKLNTWVGLCELSNIVGVTIMDIFTRGQQIRCLSQIYDLSHSLGYIIDKREVQKRFFKGAYVHEPNPGKYENIICLDFASLYPSIIQAYNICYSTFVSQAQFATIPDADCHIFSFSQEEPISGVRKGREDAVESSDDESDEDEDDDTEVKKPAKKEKEEIVTRHYTFKFVKKHIREGIVPQLCKYLVGERNVVKGKIKGVKKQEIKIINDLMEKVKESGGIELADEILATDDNDKITLYDRIEEFLESKGVSMSDTTKLVDSLSIEGTVLDKRGNALKVSANSIYGFLGIQADSAKLSLIEGAMCVTARGKELILQVNKYAEDTYGGSIIYNDTDSSFIDLHITDRSKCSEWGAKLAVEISALFPPPLRLEFEKAMRFVTIRKKKYFGNLINNDGSFERNSDGSLYIMSKGIVSATRSISQYFREIYNDMLVKILESTDFLECLTTIINEVVKLLRFSVPTKKLTMIKQLGSNYKSKTAMMKIFSSELSRMGNPVSSGDRIEYVIVRTQEEIDGLKGLKTGYKMREIAMFETSRVYEGEYNPYVYPKENIDVLWYIDHCIKKPIDQLFEVIYKKELSKYKSIAVKPTPQSKPVTIEKPINYMYALIRRYMHAFKEVDAFTEFDKINELADYIEALPESLRTQMRELDAELTASEIN